jgi:hypothetical protein
MAVSTAGLGGIVRAIEKYIHALERWFGIPSSQRTPELRQEMENSETALRKSLFPGMEDYWTHPPTFASDVARPLRVALRELFQLTKVPAYHDLDKYIVLLERIGAILSKPPSGKPGRKPKYDLVARETARELRTNHPNLTAKDIRRITRQKHPEARVPSPDKFNDWMRGH